MNKSTLKAIKSSSPRIHAPTQVHKPNKKSLVTKAIKKAAREDS